MTIKRTLIDDQDGSEIAPGALRINAVFTLEFPGGTIQSGELDFGSFDTLLAYAQAQAAAYQATLPPPTPTAPTP